jgi:hypothetical protein
MILSWAYLHWIKRFFNAIKLVIGYTAPTGGTSNNRRFSVNL